MSKFPDDLELEDDITEPVADEPEDLEVGEEDFEPGYF